MQDNLPYIKPRQDSDKPSNKSVDTVDNGDTSKLSQSRKTSTAIPPSVTRKQDLPKDDAALAENLRKLQQDEEERQREALRTQREIERKKKEMEEYEASVEAKRLAKQKEEERLMAWEKRIIEERKVMQFVYFNE